MTEDHAAWHTVEKIDGRSLARFDEVLGHVSPEGSRPKRSGTGGSFWAAPTPKG